MAAALSPDFPFVLKGRSDDCHPQSSDLDLGVCLFLLQANFYSLSLPAQEGEKSSLQGQIPPQPLALCSFNSPGSVLPEYLFSAKLFFHLLSPPHRRGCLKASNPFHILAEENSPVRLTEVIGGARYWPRVTGPGASGSLVSTSLF